MFEDELLGYITCDNGVIQPIMERQSYTVLYQPLSKTCYNHNPKRIRVMTGCSARGYGKGKDNCIGHLGCDGNDDPPVFYFDNTSQAKDDKEWLKILAVIPSDVWELKLAEVFLNRPVEE